MTTELKPPSQEGEEGSGETGTRSGRPRRRTPSEVRRVLRRLKYLTEAVRAEREARGVGRRPAENDAERTLYRALIQGEAILTEYKAGAFRK